MVSCNGMEINETRVSDSPRRKVSFSQPFSRAPPACPHRSRFCSSRCSLFLWLWTLTLSCNCHINGDLKRALRRELTVAQLQVVRKTLQRPVQQPFKPGGLLFPVFSDRRARPRASAPVGGWWMIPLHTLIEALLNSESDPLSIDWWVQSALECMSGISSTFCAPVRFSSEPIHQTTASIKTANSVQRSRFSAFPTAAARLDKLPTIPRCVSVSTAERAGAVSKYKC